MAVLRVALAALLAMGTMTSGVSSEDTAITPGSLQPSVSSTAGAQARFESWQREFGVAIHADEYEERQRIWESNSLIIEAHNRPPSTYTLAMNRFGHLTPDEWAQQYGSTYTPRDGGAAFVPAPASGNLRGQKQQGNPTSVDWVAAGAVTPIGDEAACGGACWAFSAASAVEGAVYLKTGELVPLSAQELVDCVYPKVDSCKTGGQMEAAFDYMANGVATAAAFPYDVRASVAGYCNASIPKYEASKVARYVSVARTEAALEAAVATQPVSVAIQGLQGPFMFYESGVLTQECGTQLDHGVLVVGYGHDDKQGVDYWLVKNDFGSDWGEDGYARLQKGVAQYGGQCGIALDATYPVLA